jgi:hypothetical protein
LIGTPTTKELNDGSVPIDSIIDRLYKLEASKRGPKRSRLALLDATETDEWSALIVENRPEQPPSQ